MRCGHEACTCQVERNGDFCSEHCRERAGDTGHGAHACECGHPGCQASTAEADRATEEDLQAAFE